MPPAADPAPPANAGLGKLLSGMAGYEVGNELSHDIIDTINSYVPNALNHPAQNLLALAIVGLFIYFVPNNLVSSITQRFSSKPSP